MDVSKDVSTEFSILDTTIESLYTLSGNYTPIIPIIQRNWPHVTTIRELHASVPDCHKYSLLFADDIRIYWLALFRSERMLKYLRQ